MENWGEHLVQGATISYGDTMIQQLQKCPQCHSMNEINDIYYRNVCCKHCGFLFSRKLPKDYEICKMCLLLMKKGNNEQCDWCTLTKGEKRNCPYCHKYISPMGQHQVCLKCIFY